MGISQEVTVVDITPYNVSMATERMGRVMELLEATDTQLRRAIKSRKTAFTGIFSKKTKRGGSLM